MGKKPEKLNQANKETRLSSFGLLIRVGPSSNYTFNRSLQWKKLFQLGKFLIHH